MWVMLLESMFACSSAFSETSQELLGSGQKSQMLSKQQQHTPGSISTHSDLGYRLCGEFWQLYFAEPL